MNLDTAKISIKVQEKTHPRTRISLIRFYYNGLKVLHDWVEGERGERTGKYLAQTSATRSLEMSESHVFSRTGSGQFMNKRFSHVTQLKEVRNFTKPTKNAKEKKESALLIC